MCDDWRLIHLSSNLWWKHRVTGQKKRAISLRLRYCAKKTWEPMRARKKVHVDSFSLHLTRSVDGWLFRYYLANYIARLVQLTGWHFPSTVWTIVFDLFLFLDCWNYHQVNVPLYNCMPLLFAFMELRFPITDSCPPAGSVSKPET